MLCNLYQVPYIPGVLTPSEVKIALEYGSEVIKLFPGDVSGAKMIKDLKGPFPDLNILPSGGVNVDNIADWIKSGATMVSAGTSLSAPAEKDDFNQVSINAKTFLNSYRDSIKEK